MNLFKRLHVRYILHRHAIAHELWHEVTQQLGLLRGLTAVEKAHLRELSTLFLHEKQFFGAQGLIVTDAMAVTIAAQACLPILRLGLNCLSGWTEVIVYPGAFLVCRDSVDATGVVHHEQQALVGESWSKGPLILSWQEVAADVFSEHQGRNVVIHEIAHKLDMLNGSANGFPPLHYGMDVGQWSRTWAVAYESLQERIAHHHHHRPCINAYAATNPAEFFAVLSETFFAAPDNLHNHFAAVYQQLMLYYRQDPLQRMMTNRTSSGND